MNDATGLRVLLVADDPEVAEWLLRVTDEGNSEAIQLTHASTSGDDVIADAAAAEPDVIAFDLRAGGLASLSRLGAQCPTPILLLTDACDESLRARAVRSGARGVVLKSDPPDTIRQALRKVQAGELWIDRATTGRLVKELVALAPRVVEQTGLGKLADLTARELDVVRALLNHEGASSRALAALLHMSEQTLRNHFTSIYRKLGISNRVGLVAYAARNPL